MVLFQSVVFLVVLTSVLGWVPWQVVRSVGQKSVVPAAVTVGVVAGLPQVTSAVSLLEKGYQRLKPYERLATTPLFYVCNSGGNPYLQEDIQAGDPSQRIIVYFMSSEDASDYLNEMAQGSPHNINDFRVMTTSMDKIMTKIQARKQSRKIGRYSVPTIYRIQPSSRQSEHAEKLMGSGGGGKGKGSQEVGIKTVPVFTAKGMGVIRSKGRVIAPHYFAYEDLMDDWRELTISAAEDGSVDGSGSSSKRRIPASPDVKVVDLADALCTAGLESKDSLATLGVVPPRREIDLIRKYYRGKGRRREFERAKIMKSR